MFSFTPWEVVLSVDSDLLRAYRVEDDAKVKERILMVSLLREGKSTYDAAETLHCSQSKVAYWKRRFEEGGIEGLRTRKRPGRPPKVPRAKMDEVRRILDGRDWWTIKAVREASFTA